MPRPISKAVAVTGGVWQKIHFFCLDLPHSDAGFVKAYPAEWIEAFLDVRNAVFAGFREYRLGLLKGDDMHGGMDPLTGVIAFDIREQVILRPIAKGSVLWWIS